MNVTALIVTYNRLEKLQQTVKATLVLPFQHVVIVNNASNDSTASWLAKQDDPRLHIVTSPENNGGAGGFRRGAAYICDNLSTDWVTFYDDDAWPDDSFFEQFCTLDHNTDTAYCGRVIDLAGNDCKMNIPWAKRPFGLWQNIQYSRCPDDFIINNERSAPAVTFSFVGCIISFTTLCKTWSYIEEKLFIYYDDVYYSWLLSTQGYNIRYEPRLIYHHDVKPATGLNNQEWKIYYLARNLLLGRYLYKKKTFYTPSAILLRYIKYMLQGLSINNKTLYYRFLLRGLLDGMRNNGGKRH